MENITDKKPKKKKPKLGCCKICGQPAYKDLCIIHKKIDEYLNRNES